MGRGDAAAERVVDVHLGDARLPTDGRVLVDGTHETRVLWLGGGYHALRGPLPVYAVGARVRVGDTDGVVLDPDAPRRGTTNDRLVSLTATLKSLPT